MTTKVLYKGNYHFCERFLKHFKTSQNCETVLHIQQNHLQGGKNVKWHSYHVLVSRSLVEIYLLGSASCILTTVYSSISFVIHLYTSINHIGSWISSDNLCPSVPFATVYARLQKGEVNVVWAIAEMKTLHDSREQVFSGREHSGVISGMIPQHIHQNRCSPIDCK